MEHASIPVQMIIVGLLAALGLLVVGRWLRTMEYRIWSWAWLGWAIGATCLSLGSLYPRWISWLLLGHTLGFAVFGSLMVYGALVTAHLGEVQRVSWRHRGWVLLVLMAVLSLGIIFSRWPAPYSDLWLERHFWSGPWLIGATMTTMWIIVVQMAQWRDRPACLVFVTSLFLLAVSESCGLGLLLSHSVNPWVTGTRLLDFLHDLTPVLAGFVALGMHVQVFDGLVQNLERTLVRMSKRSAKLKVMAERDPLTAVMNRHAFYSLVGAKREGISAPLGGSVAVLDIDDLKPLNDSHGHQAGDAAIRAVAKAIRSVIRAEDLLFRWGGDEFLVILPHVHVEEARWRFGKLDDLLFKTSLPGLSRPVRVTLSVGIAPFSSAVSLEKAIEEADERMYSRKGDKKQLAPRPN